MPDLLAGSTIRAADFPPSSSLSDNTAQLDLSNTTPQPGTPEVGVGFTSATTGRASVSIGMGGDTDETGVTVRLELEVYEGSDATGTLVYAPQAAGRVQIGTDDASFASRSGILVEGLTPNVTHFARVVHSVSGGTLSDIVHRSITVEPAT